MTPFLRGVLSERVPPPHRSNESMRLLAALLASLRFLRSAIPPKRPRFAPWSEGRIAPGLGFGQRSPDRESSAETARSPKVPGGTPCARALFSDPGGASASCHSDASVLPSACLTASAPASKSSFGIQ